MATIHEMAGTKTQTRRVVKPQFVADAMPVEMPATDPAGGWVVPVFNLQRTDAAKRIGRFLNEARELRRMAHTMAKSVEEPQDVDSLSQEFS